jgi:Flp pilus assembly protein TadG
MRSRTRGEAGQAAVELALILPVLLIILYVMFQFGQVYVQYQEVSAATSDGARAAAGMAGVTEPSRTSTIVATVRGSVSVGNDAGFDHNDLAVTATSAWTPGSPVTVTSSYPASVSILGVTIFSDTLKTSRTTRVLS